MRRWIGHALTIAARDLRRESRDLDHAVPMVVLALVILVLFAFIFDADSEQARRAAPGMLWTAIVFAGTIGAGRAFAGDRERGTLQGLLLAPIDRGSIYLGKLIAMEIMLLSVSAVLLPALVVLFNVPALSLGVIGAVLAGTVGFAAIATIFSAVSTVVRARDVLLPALLLPFLAPLVVAGALAIERAMSSPTFGAGLPWMELCLGIAAIYLAGGLVLIDHVLEEVGE